MQIFLIALAAAVLFQGSRGLFERDETRYAECAREMMVAHSWLVPLRGFKPHLTKPPFTYWAIAGGMAIFGKNEWGVRLPNAVAFALTVYLVGLIGMRLLGGRHGPWAAAIYLTSLFPFAASNIVTTDTLLVFWETAAIWAFVQGERAASSAGARRWFTLMGLFWGMGFLTKGVAVIPVAAPIVIYWFINRDACKAYPLGPGPIVAFLVAGFWWYAAVWYRYPESIHLMLDQQVTGRLFSDLYHRNSAWYAPFYLYLPIVVLGPMPWLVLVVRQASGHYMESLRAVWVEIWKRREYMFLFLWFSFPLLVFCLARSRLPLYILPLFPATALAVAAVIAKKIPIPPVTYRPFWGILVLLCFIKASSAMIPMAQDAKRMYETFRGPMAPAMEIDIVGSRFLDGLSFYSGKPIEWLPHSKNDSADAWEEELVELERHPEVFVLDLHKKEIEEAFHFMGLQTELITHYGRYGLFRVGRMRAGR